MPPKFELQVRSSSERLRRGHRRSASSYERLTSMMTSSCDRLPFASGADLRVRPTGSKPVWVRRQSAPEVRASSQTKLSRGFVGPAHGRERLTALAADTSQTVSGCVHETGGEESSRRLMQSQSVVPCVGRASAREPHTRVPEEEGAMGDCTRIVPLGKPGSAELRSTTVCNLPRRAKRRQTR